MARHSGNVRRVTPEMFQVFVVVFSVWGIAVALKAIHSLRTGNPYVFSMWDGGMIRAGKRLNKLGTQIKVVVGAVMAGGCIATFTKAVPIGTASYVIIFIAVLSLVSDFVTAD